MPMPNCGRKAQSSSSSLPQLLSPQTVMVNVGVTSVVVAIVARPRGCAPTPAIVVAPFRGVGVVRLAVELLVDAGGHDGVHRVECRTG